MRRAAWICGLEPGEVAWFADAVAEHLPLGIRALMGMQRHGGAAQAIRTVSCLPALTGAYARRGGGMCYSTGPAYGWNDAAATRPDLQPHGPTRQLQMSSLGRELLTRDDPPVTVLVITAANPVLSNPDQARTREGLSCNRPVHRGRRPPAHRDRRLRRPGAAGHHPARTCRPDRFLHPSLRAVERPGCRPPGECLSHTEIFRRLARALGVTEPAVLAEDDDLARAALAGASGGVAGITLESLQEKGWQRLSHPDPYLPFAECFPTASGRFEFTSLRAESAGAGLLPGYTAPHEALGEPGDGRLALISAANHYLINSTFTGSPWHARAGGPVLQIHPEDAAVRGLADGATARVGNGRGSFTARVQVTDAVRPGVVATSKGLASQGPDGAAVNATTADRDSDLGGGATFHDNRVQVTSLAALGE